MRTHKQLITAAFDKAADPYWPQDHTLPIGDRVAQFVAENGSDRRYRLKFLRATADFENAVVLYRGVEYSVQAVHSEWPDGSPRVDWMVRVRAPRSGGIAVPRSRTPILSGAATE